LAKLHWRWGANADVVIRMPTGAGVGAGPFHSQSSEAWFFHTPGLKVVYPSNPADAKGLLIAAFDDPNPVLFFEHKALYRSVTGPVQEGYYTVPFGKAATARAGSDAVVITYGAAVHWALEAAEKLSHEGAGEIEVLDLRTLLPWDKEAVQEAVRRTGKVLVLHEDSLTGGIGAEIAAWISEHCFTYLDAPVLREAAPDLPIPFAPSLEKDFLSKGRVEARLRELVGW
jgi:2-oxoisovalerate dehydrogenase E1 component